MCANIGSATFASARPKLPMETRRLDGALTGAPAVGDATLRFSALTGVAAMIETVPLEEAPAAYAKMMAGKARFRIALTMPAASSSPKGITRAEEVRS